MERRRYCICRRRPMHLCGPGVGVGHPGVRARKLYMYN
jgi:hypothetical protein